MSAELPEPKVGDVWYRYESKSYSVTVDADMDIYSTCRKLECHTYKVEKITPKGVRLDNDKVVIRTALKQYAHPTKQLALDAYIARKEKQISILNRQLDQAGRDLTDAKLYNRRPL